MKKTLAIMLLIVMSMSLVFAQGSSEAKKTEDVLDAVTVDFSEKKVRLFRLGYYADIRVREYTY